MFKVKTALPILCWLMIVALSTATTAPAQQYPLASNQASGSTMVRPAQGANMALGLSYFVGPTSGEPFEVITGYDLGLVYTATGNSVEVTDQGLVLHRDGTYRIHLEGVLALDDDDMTADEGAAAIFSLLINGDVWVNCWTPGNTAAPTLAVDWRFTPDHERLADCTVDFTVQVQGDGSPPGVFPLIFPRHSLVQAALVPNDLALGDATLLGARFEITRSR